MTVKIESTNNTTSTTNPLNDIERPSQDIDRMNIPYAELHFHREIGAGAYGKVFVGEWQMTTVAMKISGYTSSDEFMREAALLVYVSKVSKCQK